MSDLYDTDTLTWSQRQAELLRRLAAGERINSDDLDWPNIIEEIESVGRGEYHAIESWWTLAFLHDLKAEGWTQARYVDARRSKARGYRARARRRYRPSLRQHIDLAGLYADALATLPATMDGVPPLPVEKVCPVTLEQLLADETAP
jgi:hypothetical protein